MKDALLGRTVAQRYRLISRLGSGGVASVYLARHVLIDRLSAIKIVHPHLGSDPVYGERFLREARAVNRINHPNIVEIDDLGEADGLVYLVMEYVPGESLAHMLARGPIGWRRAAGIGLQIAAALGRAHQMGVIHRDLKPANVLVVPRRDGSDLAKLTDFGVAKLADATTLTGSAIAQGTPGYTAPEYRHYGSVDARSDLFSLGVLLYEATAGVLPFGPEGAARESAPTAIGPGSSRALERLGARVADVPAFFDEVVMTLLAPDPDDRPRDGFEAADLLHRALDSERVGPQASPGTGTGTGTGTGMEAEIDARAEPNMARRGKFLSEPPASGAPGSDGARAPLSASISKPRGHGPHLTTAPFDRIAPACATALARIEARAAAAEEDERVAAGMDEARRLVAMVSSLGDLVAADARAIEDAHHRGRVVGEELGVELDDVAREHSRALGWAGTIAERTYLVQARRVSGAHPVPAVEAMVWEQAALETEEDRVRESAAEIEARMHTLEAQLDEHTEQLDHDLRVANASLDGHIAALRSIALEAWLALESAGGRVDLSPQALSAPASVAP